MKQNQDDDEVEVVDGQYDVDSVTMCQNDSLNHRRMTMTMKVILLVCTSKNKPSATWSTCASFFLLMSKFAI